MGFPPNDIRIVANRQFLQAYPDIKHLLSKVTIVLEDISRQNARMLNGEDTYEDIQRHAQEWISRNRPGADSWLTEAKSLQTVGQPAGTTDSPPIVESEKKILRVVTQRSEPFVVYQNRQYAGFSIELWGKIAQNLGVEYRIYGVNTIANLLDDVKRGAADVAVAGIGITSSREGDLDFSHAYYKSGLQIMVPEGSDSLLGGIVLKALAIVL
jgi:ABC-type amino acid transport substrate-binding protein